MRWDYWKKQQDNVIIKDSVDGTSQLNSLIFLCMYCTSCTVYYPDQQMQKIYILTIFYIYRKCFYMFRCTRIIFRESYPSTLLDL